MLCKRKKTAPEERGNGENEKQHVINSYTNALEKLMSVSCLLSETFMLLILYEIA